MALTACSNDYDAIEASSVATGTGAGAASATSSAGATSSGGAGPSTGGGGAGSGGAGVGTGGATSTGGSGGAPPYASVVCADAPTDTFDGPVTAKWVAYENSPSELDVDEDQRLEIDVGVSGGQNFAGITSAAPFTLDECHVLVRVGVLPGNVDGTVYLQVVQPAQPRPQLAVQLVAGQFVGVRQLGLVSGVWGIGEEPNPAGPAVAYDSTDHAWWRIRHHRGSIHVEAGPAPDDAFELLATLPDGDFTGPLLLAVGAGTYANDFDAERAEAWFDDINSP